MASYTEETKSALAIGEAAMKIVKTLDPLSTRGKQRIMTFFMDLVQDPTEDCSVRQVEILKEVAKHLGIRSL